MMIRPDATEDMIDEMSRVLRVNRTSASDEEITSLVQAAVLDLQRQGVQQICIADPLIWQSIKLYCKGHYGYDKDSEKFAKAYEAISAGLALCGEYAGGDHDDH